MKKSLTLLVLLLISSAIFSQKIIEKPDYGFSNLPGKLTKIELTDSATIIHFYIKYPTGAWIFIPKESYIQDVNGGEKYFVTKTEGIPLGERYTMTESGEVSYQLHFPKLNASVDKVDFGEANEGGNWTVYDIVINKQETVSILPKELQGNWLQTDGSNQWDYSFYAHQAVVDQGVWNYIKVEKKKNNYTIVLENKGKLKTIYAQIDKKGNLSLGEDKQNLKMYSTNKVDNPNYKPVHDEVFTDAIFKTDSATYSGVIKGFSPRAGKKTGMIHVQNVFASNQDSYLVEIAADGSFSVKFPINHPQTIYVDLLGNRLSVFVEPGKETFQLIDRDVSLFMGDCARINSDLLSFGDPYRQYEAYRELMGLILETSPEDYKKACLNIKDNQLQIVEAMSKKQFISQKALQIKKLDVEFLCYEQILSYEMNRESAEGSKLFGTSTSVQKSVDFKLDKSYFDFITPSVLNNELGVLSNNYYFFINRLRFANIFRNANSVRYSYNSFYENIELLQKSGITLTALELQMIAEGKEIDKTFKKSIDFYNANQSGIQKFIEKHKEVYTKLQKDKPNINVTIHDLATYLKSQGIVFTPEEKELLSAFKSAQATKKEIAIQKAYFEKYGESLKQFNEKYKANFQEIEAEKRFEEYAEIDFQELNNKLNDVFGTKESYVFDVITLQKQSGDLERNFIPYSVNQLKWIQGKINNPFLSNYIVYENDKLKNKLEANKTKTGFTVNQLKKSAGDELFDSMIAKFKGKVIYVDFWATWCGPCKQGIKEIAPLKEDMKDKDVVFLYITGETSPLKTWENSIPDIKGEHYRVTADEWNYLTQKFNISGIPHYVLVNKNGEVVNPKLGHNSNESLKQILEKEM
ncbi:TlpA family protein disulfide reductase [Flavobacterium sp. MAHUQ-51]|uniref:TlpA family protein disulfide reductase n=1 Tax=Flavobacterium sp. GCM10022190 TaxID=3252639 RepID=UPI00361BC72E